MKLVQIIYLTILTAASVSSTATEVVTADAPEATIACPPSCASERPSNCPGGTFPYLLTGACWACCFNP
ncbi:hypothetical protein BDR03DRAFT_964514 [Suillus americanus]|nr:hypothetical protein BDR03DRAFT_964514 [Suillus americanus]